MARKRLPLEWRIGLLLMLAASFFMSGFFDSLVIQVMGERQVSREIRIAVAVGLAGLLGMMALVSFFATVPRDYAARERPAFEWPLKIFLLLTPFWAVAGFINQWPVTYVMGDVFLLSLLPLTYFTLTRRPLTRPRYVFAWIYGLMLLLAIVSSCFVFWHNLVGMQKDKMSVDAALVPIFYTMLKASPTLFELALLPIFVLAAIITTKRSTWAGIIVFVAMALMLRPGMKRSLRLLLVVGAMGGIVIVVQDQKPEWIEHASGLLSYRWEETQEDFSSESGDLGSAAGGRMGEVFGVIDTIQERRNPIDWVTGLGLGAIVQARGGRERHHIHSTPATFLARTGLVGLVLWLSFAFLVLMYIIKYARRQHPEWYRVQLYLWLGLWVSMLIFSLKSQAFWGSAVGGIQLAFIYHVCRMSENLPRVAIDEPAA